jgi:hypothetical protein
LVSRAVGECGRLRSCRGSVPALTPHNGRGDEPTGSPTLAWGSGGTSCSLVLSALFFVGSYKVWPRRMMTAAMQWART